MVVGAVVVQIFMQPRRYSVLHGGLHRVSRKPGAQAFAKTGGAAAILSRRLTQLRHTGARRHASQRGLPDGGMLPARAVGMTLPCDTLRDSGGQQHQQRKVRERPAYSGSLYAKEKTNQ